MTSSSLVTPATLLSILLAACAGGPVRRLDTSGVPLAGGTARGAIAAAPAPNGTQTRFDLRLEEQLRRELADQWEAGGKAAIERIEPGESDVSQLRFALSRLQLDRLPDAEAALARLLRERPDCALTHVLLGQVHRRLNHAERAVELLGRAGELELAQGLSPHPARRLELALAMLLAGQSDSGLRLLREELAEGPHRVRAAEVLAQVAVDAGEFEEALAALDAVLDDEPDQPGLVAAKVGVLADQLRHDEALDLITRHGGRLDPLVRLDLRAMVAWRRGALDEALALVDEAIAAAGAGPEAATVTAELRGRRQAIEADRARGGRSQATIPELLGLLRYAPREAQRKVALEVLCRRATGQASRHAVRWALRDPSAAVRVVAFRLGTGGSEDAAAMLAAGLRDPDPAVRCAAAAATLDLPGDHAGSLVDALAAESDPEAFRTVHRVLLQIRGRDEFMPFAGEQEAAVRSRVVEDWRADLLRPRGGRGKS